MVDQGDCAAKDGAEVVLITIAGMGHTWPGRVPLLRFLGPATRNVSANVMMWEFFQKHAMHPKTK
jgi:polyhydroxybutyrate depolymerase